MGYIRSMPPSPLARVVTALLLGAIVIASNGGTVSAAAPGPNFILITADDLGMQLGSYGDHTIETPNIDRIATEGTRFQNAFVTQSSCSASRSSIFTGTYPHQNGQIGLAHLGFSMSEPFPTIPSILHEAGYRTGIIGKVHVNPESAFVWDFNPPYQDWEWRTRDVRRVATEARSFFQSTNQPFFLKVSYLDPHIDNKLDPWTAINQVLSIPVHPLTVADININTWTGQAVPDIDKPDVAAYYNCIKRIDEGVGLLIEALEESGFADNTMIVFLGDNGPETVQGGKPQVSGGKADFFENGLRVPLLIRYPAIGKSEQVRSELVSAVDLPPTILEAAGLAVPPTTKAMMTEGRSLLPIIKGDAVVDWRKFLFAEMNYHNPDIYRPSRSVRDSRYKLVKSYPPLDRGINGLTLFDLKKDPFETRNLVDNPTYSVILNRLLTQLANWQLRSGDSLLSKTSPPLNVAGKSFREQADTARDGRHDCSWDKAVPPNSCSWSH